MYIVHVIAYKSLHGWVDVSQPRKTCMHEVNNYFSTFDNLVSFLTFISQLLLSDWDAPTLPFQTLNPPQLEELPVRCSFLTRQFTRDIQGSGMPRVEHFSFSMLDQTLTVYQKTMHITPFERWCLCNTINHTFKQSERKSQFELKSFLNDQKMAWYTVAQLVEHCTSIAEVMGSNPVQAWIFFRL